MAEKLLSSKIFEENRDIKSRCIKICDHIAISTLRQDKKIPLAITYFTKQFLVLCDKFVLYV